MRIAIDIRPALKNQKTGIGYYVLNLTGALAGLDKDNLYELYSKIRFFSRSRKPPSLPGGNFSHRIDRFGLGPAGVLNKKTDVFYSSSFDVRPPPGAKFVLGLHDIIPKVSPCWHTADAVNRLKAHLPAALAAAGAIVVDAASCAGDLAEHYPGYEGKVSVVYPGIEEGLVALPPSAKNLYKQIFLRYNIHSNYIIYVGTLEPRKNLKGLLAAFSALKQRHRIKQQLVITGMKGWGWEETFNLTEELGLKDDVIFTGYVPRDDINALYSFADLSAYPSFYEGAGLPVLEAFKCGCPVVTSDTSCMPEFAGGAAVLVDPYNPESIAEGIYSILSSGELRKDLVEKGLRRAAEFTWEKTARAMLDIFAGARGAF